MIIALFSFGKSNKAENDNVLTARGLAVVVQDNVQDTNEVDSLRMELGRLVARVDRWERTSGAGSKRSATAPALRDSVKVGVLPKALAAGANAVANVGRWIWGG